MPESVLQHIQTLQFSDKGGAEALLLSFIRDNFPFEPVSVDLRPSAVSLNSFNGFMMLQDGHRLFFKTHTETDTAIDEYYQAETLEKAGYPVIKPIFSSTEVGKQFLVYEVIESSSVFDFAWSLEVDELPQEQAEYRGRVLSEAQKSADKQLFELYQNSLEWQTDEGATQAPIHQLFYHRLMRGRLERFYGPLPMRSGVDKKLVLPSGSYSSSFLRQLTWKINGRLYNETLDDIIRRAIQILKPSAGPAVIGHGDAHNGNVFLLEASRSVLYFDPAFAGVHNPLLDLVKPLFHNVFAMWMYFPFEKYRQTQISIKIENNQAIIEHDYMLHPVREMFLTSKIDYVLSPLLHLLQQRNWLRPDWKTYLKAALFCCPFLTMNLADSSKFPPEITLLGLTMSVEMGSYSQTQPGYLDNLLDQIDF